MKKFVKALAVGLLAGLMAISMGACSSGTTNTASTTSKTYIIATDTTFAPFEFQDANGNYTGVDMDILDAIAKDQGFSYEVQALGFDAALQAVQAGQADGVIAGMSITDDRKQVFDFSDPYFDSGVVMGIASDNDTITSYADLKGQKVAAKTGTEGAAFAESIADQYGFTITYFKDSAVMYADVTAGNTVACFEDYPVLSYAITQNVGLKIVTQKERGSSYGFAVAKGQNAELLSMFNAGLADIMANGTYQSILDKYGIKEGVSTSASSSSSTASAASTSASTSASQAASSASASASSAASTSAQASASSASASGSASASASK